MCVCVVCVRAHSFKHIILYIHPSGLLQVTEELVNKKTCNFGNEKVHMLCTHNDKLYAVHTKKRHARQWHLLALTKQKKPTTQKLSTKSGLRG